MERLPEQDNARLRVLTFEPKPPDNLIPLDNTRACDGTYVCGCVSCALERARRLRTGVRPSRQPWHGKKAA